jgi:hypothetical protein
MDYGHEDEKLSRKSWGHLGTKKILTPHVQKRPMFSISETVADSRDHFQVKASVLATISILKVKARTKVPLYCFIDQRLLETYKIFLTTAPTLPCFQLHPILHRCNKECGSNCHRMVA